MLKILISSALILSNLILLNDTDLPAVEFSNKNSEITAFHIPFISNEGQLPERILYYAPLQTGYVYLDFEGLITYDFRLNTKDKYNRTVIYERFENSIIHNISTGEKSPLYINKIAKSQNSVKTIQQHAYEDVIFERVYEGIDVRLNAANGGIEKIFYIQPGADPNEIKISVSGGNELKVEASGQLAIITENGRILFSEPVAFQEIDGKQKFVDIEYIINGNSYGFKTGDYDHTKELIIDPVIASTFIGGSGSDGKFFINTKMKIDSEGYIYLAGSTNSADFPTTLRALSREKDSDIDIFIAKFSNDLSRLYLCTYIGGSGSDELVDFLFDNEGNIIITGFTTSTDFPVTENGFQQEYMGGETSIPGMGDTYISIISNDLSTLLASTYFGVDGNDIANGIALDNEGNIYITGRTTSSNLPMVEGLGYKNNISATGYGVQFDGFISKFDSQLSNLLSSTYFGRNGEEIVDDIEIAPNGNVYIAGSAPASIYFPTTENSLYPNPLGDYRTTEVFISCFDETLTDLIYCTFYGGEADDFISDIEFDNDGNLIITGSTYSTNLDILSNSCFNSMNGIAREIYISKLDPALSQLLGVTYLGGSFFDSAVDLCVDQYNQVYVTGQTYSYDFPSTETAFDKIYNGSSAYPGDIFISKFDTDLSTLMASTYLGGSYSEGAGSITIAYDGTILISGFSYSPDYPVSDDPYCMFLNWGYDVIVTKLDPDLSADPTHTEDINELPEQFILHANFPNPFNPSTNIRFDLPTSEHVNLTVYNPLGEKITTLVGEILPAGIHTINFDASNLKSGMYIYRIEAGSFVESRKMLLVK